jgi:cysteinyl-tRNA synthetase, unknown class
MRKLVLIVSAIVMAIGLAAFIAARLPSHQHVLTRQGPELSTVKTWGYQLQAVKPTLIDSSIDLLVVDYTSVASLTSDGFGGHIAPAVESLRQRPDGSRRIVLCYLSIGEAERYRPYWRRSWDDKRPAWLGNENVAWKGNYTVRYEDPAWQKIILDPSLAQATLYDRLSRAFSPTPPPYLDQIIDAGFDGVYLDRVDAYETTQASNPHAKAQMVAFVAAISTYAKDRRPGFLILPQNGEDLAVDSQYRRAIDGMAKEDLLYGESGDGAANIADEIRHNIGHLNRIKAEGKPVFVVEYLADPTLQRAAITQLKELGYVTLFAERGLKLPPLATSKSPIPSKASVPAP